MGNNRTRPDNRSSPDRYVGENCRAVPEPDIVTDRNGLITPPLEHFSTVFVGRSCVVQRNREMTSDSAPE
jgi:hypothetical protein